MQDATIHYMQLVPTSNPGPGSMFDMDVDCNRDCITFATDYRTINGGDGMQVCSIKAENDANLAAHAQTISSMVTLTPEALANSGMPMGTFVSMGAPNGSNLSEQVVFTLQPMNGNVVEANDDAKNELNNSIAAAAMANANAAKLNGTTQILTGGLQTMVNLQGLSAMPQMNQLSLPGMTFGSINQLSSSNNPQQISTIGHPSNTNPAQTTQVALQQMPQHVGMPQLILAGGQFLQGIQGAQLFIPTSSGVATQQILTIPVNQIPSGQQLMQVMAPNGQVITTSMNNLNNLQAMASQQTAGTNGIHAPTVLANNVQSFGQNQILPQIITNAAGQILAMSPQLIGQSIGQSPGVVQVYGSPGQLQSDKHQILQTNGQMTVSSSKNPVSAPVTSLIPTQSHIQISNLNEANAQVSSQNLQRTSTTPTQVIQVDQTSSPSVTSTESTTPISQTNANTVDGINLEEIKEFAKAFKIRRLSLGLTQTQVGQALSVTEGPAYSQSAICRFEKLDITPKSAQKIKPVLERWMIEAERRYKNGADNLTDFIGTEPSKKRKRRTSFTPQALDILNQYFERNTHPSGTEMTEIAEKLNYEREVVRVWFCNKRQTLKNSVKKLKIPQ